MQTLLIAAAILAVPAANAETKTMRVNIPFQFVAGDVVLGAGTYTVDIQSASNRLEIRNVEGTAGAYIPVRTAARRGSVEQGSALFHKYGDTYILKHVSAADRWQGHDLPSTKVERELAKRHSSVQLAWIGAAR